MRLTDEGVVSLQSDLLVLVEQVQLRIEVVGLVEGSLARDLSLLNADIQLPLLLKQHLKDSDVCVHIVSHMGHLRV